MPQRACRVARGQSVRRGRQYEAPCRNAARTSAKPSATSAGFAALGLDDQIVAAVASLGYEEPTPVQRETIPLLLEGRDLLGTG